VIVPAVKLGHKWEFSHIKSLSGEGRLYTQLNVSSKYLLEREGEGNDEKNLNPESSITIDEASSPKLILRCSLYRNGTRATLVGDKHSHHSTIPAPLSVQDE